MKKNSFFKRSNPFTALILALTLTLGFLITPPLTARADGGYSSYDWDDYDYYYSSNWAWDDDEAWEYFFKYFWEDDDYDDRSSRKDKPSGYLKLRTRDNCTYFSDIKQDEYARYIDWCGRHGLLKGIAKKGEKLNPDQDMTQKELKKMLKNGYRGYISIGSGGSNTALRQRYFCQLTTKVARQLRYTLRWNGGKKNAKMDRASVCYCFYYMVKNSKGKLYTVK